jgi:hypothetical protein
MFSNQQRATTIGVIALVIGWAIGLFLFGWWLWPVQYEGAGPQDLTTENQSRFLNVVADLYAFDGNQQRVRDVFGAWPEADESICAQAAVEPDPAQTARLEAIAAVLNGQGCVGVGIGEVAPTEVEETGAARTLGNILLICGLLLLLGVLVAAIAILVRRRGLTPYGEEIEQASGSASTTAAIEAEQKVTPLARFQTTYVRGHDTYDDSFSIENADGDFLGECGVGLSETIGAEAPKNVTAFEIWLFDKHDIRTVTKVLMSDQAFFDEAIKAKLAPKGEPVLARPNETIVLETASLIVNAEITEMEYGTGTLPPQSFFERFTVELSAWAKEGEFDEADVQGRIDEMLDF